MKFAAILLTLQLSFSFTFSQSNTEQLKYKYELVSDSDGLVIERFDSTVVDENKYNHNNSIYKVGSCFKYIFEHVTKDGEKKYFKTTKDTKGWEFVTKRDNDSCAIKELIIEVDNGNPLAKYMPDYNQTCLIYKMNKSNGFSKSGGIENEANVWIHPPRDKYFKILELNPFPYIKAPYEIGTEWTWNLAIGNTWADERWKQWEGQIKNKYNYKIIDKEILQTKLGELECFVIEADAKSRIGVTRLVAYFNLKYGFVKLQFTNIDESQTNLELVDFSVKYEMNNPYKTN